jgi:hypothetical protein
MRIIVEMENQLKSKICELLAENEELKQKVEKKKVNNSDIIKQDENKEGIPNEEEAKTDDKIQSLDNNPKPEEPKTQEQTDNKIVDENTQTPLSDLNPEANNTQPPLATKCKNPVNKEHESSTNNNRLTTNQIPNIQIHNSSTQKSKK